MAFIQCESCGKKYSDKAPECPHCKMQKGEKPHISGQISMILAIIALLVPYMWATIVAPAAIATGAWATSQKQKKYGYIAMIVGTIAFGWTIYQGQNIQQLLGGVPTYTQAQEEATPEQYNKLADTNFKIVQVNLEAYYAENYKYPITVYDAVSYDDISPGIIVEYTPLNGGQEYSLTCYHVSGSERFSN